MSKPGKLYLIPTPLAENSGARVLPAEVPEAVGECGFFLVEDLRSARRFISSLKLGLVIDQLHFYELNKDTSPEKVKKYFEEIPLAESIGVMSDAGCPGVADPGALAVEWAHKKGRDVIPLTGPSSILLALMASGFNGQAFAFHGYVPIDKEERSKYLKGLERESAQRNQTQVFMDTPYRNNQLLDELIRTCMPETRVCIACNLHSEEQWVKVKRLKEWKTSLPDLHKKPVMFLLYAR